MVTRTVTIYQVGDSYVSTGGSTTILAIGTLEFVDAGDGSIDATSGADPGGDQILYYNGVEVDSYQFLYDDTSSVDGTTQTIKTFQLTIGGVTQSFIMNDDDDDIASADIGDTVTLISDSGYTAVDYEDLPCFARGTRIETKAGLQKIESLQVGDLVKTMDHDFEPIRWIGSTRLTPRDLFARPNLRPVCVAKDAFGLGLPIADLFVSPQHRVLISGWAVELHFALQQVLVPAKGIVSRDKAHEATAGVEYFHMMFDQHEIVFSEGLPTESFYVGDAIRDGMDQAQLGEILALFPELATDIGRASYKPARPLLSVREARPLTA